MKNLHVPIGCFFFFLLQMLLSPRIAIGEVSPDFALLLVAYFAMNRAPSNGAVAGFLVGFLQDLFNPELLGLNALTKSIAGYILGVAGTRAEPGNIPFTFVVFGGTAIVHDFVYLLFFTGLDFGRFFTMLLTVAIPSAAYTAIVGIVVHTLAMYLQAKVVKAFGKARSQG